MSLSKIIDINCPNCKNKQSFRIWQSINVTEDFNLKEDVFNQDIFRFSCNNCKNEIFIEYPFIYHDYDKKFFVYFDSLGKFENIIENEGYKTKVSSEYLEFLEFIRILEDDVDESKVKSAKDELFSKFSSSENLKNIDKLYYSGMKDGKLEFFVPAINGKITV